MLIFFIRVHNTPLSGKPIWNFVPKIAYLLAHHHDQSKPSNIDTDEPVELRIHDLTPRCVRELQEMGNRHITKRFIGEMQQEYGDDLTIAQLLE